MKVENSHLNPNFYPHMYNIFFMSLDLVVKTESYGLMEDIKNFRGSKSTFMLVVGVHGRHQGGPGSSLNVFGNYC